jgi:hypothetical protein
MSLVKSLAITAISKAFAKELHEKGFKPFIGIRKRPLKDSFFKNIFL